MCIPVLISVCVIKYNNGVLLNNPHSNQIDNGILAFSSTSTQNDIYRIHTKASLLADISSCKFRNKSILCFISIFYVRKMGILFTFNLFNCRSNLVIYNCNNIGIKNENITQVKVYKFLVLLKFQ